MRAATRCALWMLGLFAAQACGGEAAIDPATSGAGGASSSTVTTSSGSTTSQSTSTSGPASCFAGHGCAPSEYCAMDGCDVAGSCEPRPDGCDDDCPGVCGCDGVDYCNACEAHVAGTEVAATGNCVDDVSYRASLYSGALDHLRIFKRDDSAHRCVVLYAHAPGTNQDGFDFLFDIGPGSWDWGVANGRVSNNPDDCDEPPAGTGDTHPAVGGQGIISGVVPEGMSFPCEISIDASLTFDDPPAWASDSELMIGTMAIEGVCP